MRRLDESGRFLSPEECERTARRILALAQGGGNTGISISSWWNGELRWARNRTSLAGDRRDISVSITRQPPGGPAVTATTNQLDDVSLESATRIAERAGSLRVEGRFAPPLPLEAPTLPAPPKTAIWSDATSQVTAEMRGGLAQALTDGSEAKGMLSAGFMSVRAAQVMHLFHVGGKERTRYDRYTNAQCSMTVRHPKGTGSGWAGVTSYDWPKIDARALAERALEKCVASLDPVRIEPGRYTVILEPQAVYQLVVNMIRLRSRNLLATREYGEEGGAYTLGPDHALGLLRSKLGVKLVDERVTISFDPADPALGVIPYEISQSTLPAFEPVTPLKYIERGVLTGLAYDREYALTRLNDNLGAVVGPGSFRMAGGDTSVEEMIKSTKRGLLVTRFSNMNWVHKDSILMTGLTRDGLWLIEEGKISKAVKNLRFTESPLFVLNQLEALGPAVPVFTDGSGEPDPAIVPPIKARDFSFTAMIDAV